MSIQATRRAIDWAIALCFALIVLLTVAFIGVVGTKKSEPQSYSCCGSDICARQHHHGPGSAEQAGTN
jgi:hypothetical protein